MPGLDSCEACKQRKVKCGKCEVVSEDHRHRPSSRARQIELSQRAGGVLATIIFVSTRKGRSLASVRATAVNSRVGLTISKRYYKSKAVNWPPTWPRHAHSLVLHHVPVSPDSSPTSLCMVTARTRHRQPASAAKEAFRNKLLIPRCGRLSPAMALSSILLRPLKR